MTTFKATGAGEWLRGEGRDCDVVMSSRVRLARNFAGFPFVARCGREEKRHVLDLARRSVMSGALAQQMIWVDLCEVSQLERSVLVERHLISKQHSKGDDPRAVAVSSPDERLSVMVNEEDHLRLQVIRSGLALSDAFKQIDAADDIVETAGDYAFHPRWGYLTACPTNVGTGIRVSVMIHLPGLKLSGEIEKVRRAAKGMSLAVRGFYGEGSEAVGDFFQISNQTTLGKSEADILQEFEQHIIPKVIEYERLARRNLLEKRRTILEDRVHRSLGVLRHARLLKSEEALEHLSYVRLGVVMGLIAGGGSGASAAASAAGVSAREGNVSAGSERGGKGDRGVNLEAINHLILFTQPAHLQRLLKKDLDQAARRAERATLVRQALGGN